MRDVARSDPGELVRLTRAHARLAHALRTDPPEETGHDLARWRDLDERLCSLLVLDSGRSHRVNVIGANPIFPPEWREAAWATLLPDELAEWAVRWRRWYDETSAGGFRHYRERLRTWDTSRLLAETQEDLLATARATLDRTNAWTRKPAFVEARHGVFALPNPPTAPAPGPPPRTVNDDRVVPGQREQHEVVMRHGVLLEQAARGFSRVVPGAFKRHPPAFERRPPALPGEPVRDPWVEGFFDWLDPVVRAGQGLYLWT
ncbi:hypothetical protein [Nonomuraea maheshkhaliensis]|uniref:hypothetical protein n=1 Tax=Nonomuraea maheshkhaliensis TaxID=419590 RepID=UPI0031F7B982